MSIPENNDDNLGSPAPKIDEKVREDFGAVADTAKHDLGAIQEQAAQDVRNVTDQAKEHLGAATEKAKSFASEQKDLAAGQLGGIAAAISKVADELDGSEQQSIARYARDLASGLSRASDSVKDKDVDDLMGIAQDFGRTQPLAFLGAAALAGFVASRFALASTHRRENKPASGTPHQSNTYQPANSTAYAAGQSNGLSTGETDNGK